MTRFALSVITSESHVLMLKGAPVVAMLIIRLPLSLSQQGHWENLTLEQGSVLLPRWVPGDLLSLDWRA